MGLQKIKISIVDDHKVVSNGLKAIFSTIDDFEVADIATSGEQLLAQLVNGQPDIIVLDYNLSATRMSGLETAKKVLELYPQIKILMLTMHDQPEIIVPCVENGVHGYMLKNERDADIERSIRALSETGSYFSPEVAVLLARNITKYHAEKIEISQREQEVLQTIFEGNSAKEAAEILFISPSTVETHRKNLIAKFEAKNVIHLIYKALKGGYLKLENHKRKAIGF